MRSGRGRFGLAVLLVTGGLLTMLGSGATQAANPKVAFGRSTTIALTSDEKRLVVINREANSLSIIQVKGHHDEDVAQQLAEIPVDEEPRCVAVHPSDDVAYVTNGISGTVSVVNLKQGKVVKKITVGTEPRGCALTADGSLLYVANHTEGTVSILDTSKQLDPILLPTSVHVGCRPT